MLSYADKAIANRSCNVTYNRIEPKVNFLRGPLQLIICTEFLLKSNNTTKLTACSFFLAAFANSDRSKLQYTEENSYTDNNTTIE